MDLNRLQVFASVVEQRSFTGAGRSLGVQKASVSKAVAQLERALGVRLLHRTSRSMRPTPAGEALYRSLRPALALIHDALDATTARGTEPRGLVRLSCPPDFDELIADYVARFRAEHGAVQVHVSLTTRVVDLIGEGFDLALRGGELGDSALSVTGLSRSEFGLFTAAAYLASRRAPRRMEELHDHACIGVRADGGRVTWTLAGRDGAPRRITLDCAITTDDMRLAIRLARGGAGVALLPVLTVQSLVEEGALVRVLPSLAMRNVSLRLVSARRGLEPAAVRLFREGLLRERWVQRS